MYYDFEEKVNEAYKEIIESEKKDKLDEGKFVETVGMFILKQWMNIGMKVIMRKGGVTKEQADDIFKEIEEKMMKDTSIKPDFKKVMKDMAKEAFYKNVKIIKEK